MTIREAVDEDIPTIVNLLKISLGESLMPKSEAFWKWKHVDNPFGKSPVLLAFENDLLIGVRAFMRWEWRQGDKIYKAVRAVDTATHPEYMGKGIFKKLTLQLVQQCRAEGVDFIFNSPNKVSKQGYLKMGWMSNGKMTIHIKPVLPFRTRITGFDSKYAWPGESIGHAFDKTQSDYLVTNTSPGFFKWRYEHSPNVRYYAFYDDEHKPTYLTIFRLKPFRFGTEFRICSALPGNSSDNRAWREHLMRVVRDSGASIITSATGLNLFPTLSLAAGPEITTFPFSFDKAFLTFQTWRPTLGDMEVF